MKIQLLTLITFQVLLTFSCTKSKIPLWNAPPPADTILKLPPATQTGAMTFGCLVDGKVFVNKFIGVGGLTGSWSDGNMIIYAGNGSPIGEYVNPIFILRMDYFKNNINTPKQYKIDSLIINNYYLFLTRNDTDYFYNDSGLFNLTKLDEINGIFSGTFQLNAKNDSTGRIVRVREGRFDIRYKF